MTQFTLQWSEAKYVHSQASTLLSAIIWLNLESLARVDDNLRERVEKRIEEKFVRDLFGA